MSAVREKIIEAGVQEATPLPYGKVSDIVRDADGNRAGWRVLKSYFDEAVFGWSERNWQGRGEILVGGSRKNITYLQGVQTPTYRVPQPSKPSGVSWCGIFATWVLRKAGVHAFWQVGVGITGPKVVQVAGNEGYQRGDVLVMNNKLQDGSFGVHHAIFMDEDLKIYGGGGSLRTINGNSDYQSIIIHSKYTRKDVGYYFKILD